MKFSSSLRATAIAAIILSVSALSARAETPVAVIDLSKVIEVSAVGKDLQAKFKAKKEDLQKEAIAYEKDLQAKEQTLMKDKKTLDEKAFGEKRKSFEAGLKKKRAEILEKNVSLEKTKNNALKTIQTKIAQISADIADEKKIQVVLDRTAVVIAQGSLDITADVIKKLDSDLKTVPLK